jgi:hypothetical protein
MKAEAKSYILNRIFCVILFSCCSVNIMAQLPEQDCAGAIVMLSASDTFQSYLGEGSIYEVGPQQTTCLYLGEENSVWITFTMCDTGYCLFKIIPDIYDIDYDWAVYNLTNHTCEDVFDTLSQNELRCNYSAIPGPTGLDTGYTGISVFQGGPNKCAPLSTFAGQKLLLLVNNHDAENIGFVLSFGGTSLPCNFTGINSSKDMETLVVYPNPSNGNITLKNLPPSNFYTAEVVDLFGKIRHREIIIGNSDQNISLKIASGFYVLRLLEGNKLVTHKSFVISR